jgi:hypothetical protein
LLNPITVFNTANTPTNVTSNIDVYTKVSIHRVSISAVLFNFDIGISNTFQKYFQQPYKLVNPVTRQAELFGFDEHET